MDKRRWDALIKQVRMTARDGEDDLVINFDCLCECMCVSLCVHVFVVRTWGWGWLYSGKGQKILRFSTSRLMRVWGQTAWRQSWPCYSLAPSPFLAFTQTNNLKLNSYGHCNKPSLLNTEPQQYIRQQMFQYLQ